MEEADRYLYRGISEEIHKKREGLQPKGASFYRGIIIGERQEGGDGFVIGEGKVGNSIDNAVIAHQRDSGAFPSSGVSTTPFFARAKIYATHKGKQEKGFVYKIDRVLLVEKGVVEHRVADYTQYSEIPEDDEVVLVSNNNGALPQEIVIEVISIK